MDFRFHYDRHKPPPAVVKQRQRKEQQTVLGGRQLAYGLAIPSIMISGPVGGWLLGSWLDKVLGTQFVMILLILLGVASSFWAVIDMLTKLNSTKT
jgi:F0F1-type ATP synthase assembly protein I